MCGCSVEFLQIDSIFELEMYTYFGSKHVTYCLNNDVKSNFKFTTDIYTTQSFF